MRQAASIALFLFNLGLTQAQVTDSILLDKSQILSVYTGLSKHIERDEAMSPFKYRGHSMPIEISYRYFSTKCRQIIYANFDNPELLSSLPNFENAGLNHYVQSSDIQIGYSYLLRAFSLADYKSDIYFGGEISSLLNLRRQAYINNNEFLMLDQFNSLGFKAQLVKHFTNNKQVAFASLNIPVVAYVLLGDTYNAYVGEKTDPLVNFNGNMLVYLLKHGDLVSFNKLVNFKMDVSIIQFVSNHIGFEFYYSLRYYKFTQYQDFNYSRNLQNQFLIGIVGKL